MARLRLGRLHKQSTVTVLEIAQAPFPLPWRVSFPTASAIYRGFFLFGHEIDSQQRLTSQNIPKFNIWHQQAAIFQHVAAYDQGKLLINR